MRIHGFGESVVPVTDIFMKYPPRRPGGWLRAPVKSAFTDLLMELVIYCGMRSNCARLPW